VETATFIANQLVMTQMLNHLAKLVYEVNEKQQKSLLQILLDQVNLNLTEPFCFPLDVEKICIGFLANDVKVFTSKQRPFLLIVKGRHNETKPYRVIFKSGDDLRQDVVTLTLLEIMNRIFKKENIHLPMMIYDCVSTGASQGFIECVPDAKTLSKIATEEKKSLLEWLKEKNKNNMNKFEDVVSNFSLSCAAYCVATYVLGVGDRHNDNIMVVPDGRFFHIDFGHFLGNTKSKFGVKRERTPFILTKDFIEVMDWDKNKKRTAEGISPNFEKFIQTCLDAFIAVRRNATLLVNYLNLCVASGLPELRGEEDIDYVKTALFLNLSEADAGEEYKKLFGVCLKNEWSVQLNWKIHNFAQTLKS